MKKAGKLSLVSNEMLSEIKPIPSNLCISEAVITWKVVIAVRNGKLNARCQKKCLKMLAA